MDIYILCPQKVKTPLIITTDYTVGTVRRGAQYFLPKIVTMNGDRYIGVLKDHLLNIMTIHGSTTFMQDGARCHPAKKEMKWLADLSYRVAKKLSAV